MTAPIDFWFDFGSPYAYLMAERIDGLAARHGRTVHWRPVLLFAVLRGLGLPAPMASPARLDYLLRDVPRSARLMGLTYRAPSRFPVVHPLPGRLFMVLQARDAATAVAFARGTLRAAFCDDLPPDDSPALLARAARLDGREAAELRRLADEDAARQALARSIDAAVAAQVFGSPFVHIDGEPFFGADRLPQIEACLAAGHPAHPADTPLTHPAHRKDLP